MKCISFQIKMSDYLVITSKRKKIVKRAVLEPFLNKLHTWKSDWKPSLRCASIDHALLYAKKRKREKDIHIYIYIYRYDGYMGNSARCAV